MAVSVLKLRVNPEAKLTFPASDSNVSGLAHHEVVIKASRLVSPHAPGRLYNFPQETFAGTKMAYTLVKGLCGKGTKQIPISVLDGDDNGPLEVL